MYGIWIVTIHIEDEAFEQIHSFTKLTQFEAFMSTTKWDQVSSFNVNRLG